MKYTLIPENKEVKNNRAAKKFPFSFGKIVSAIIKASPIPNRSAKNVAFGCCSLVMTTPSLFTKVSFFIKRVLFNKTTSSGTKIIVDHIITLERVINPRPVLANTAEDIPKLIPNQNTKFQNLSFVNHFCCFVLELLVVTFGLVKSCIAKSRNYFNSYSYILAKIWLITKQLIVLSIITLVIPNISMAGTIEEIIASNEKKHHIPSGLLLAIIKTESGLNPFALNINAKPVYFTNKEKAVKAINKEISSGVTNIDIGLAQINYRWHGSKFDSVESMLSIDTNISYAAQLLSDLKLKYGDWHKALRHYHSAKPVYHREYSRKVVMCWLGVINTNNFK